MTTTLHLHPNDFAEKERIICEFGELTVSTFVYSTGVAALRVKNSRGEIIVLPYKGHQIWRAAFDGRDLSMQTHFDEPVDTTTYLETYGAFFLHCGVTAIGAPGPQDNHNLHGEIPNAPFTDARLVIDEAAGSVSVVGSYRYILAFQHHYLATASVTMKAGEALIDVSLEVENRKNTPTDLMYLGHANFAPADHGELHYTAHYDAEHVRVRKSIPSHVTPLPGYQEFLDELADDPAQHHVLRPDLAFDPEVVFYIDFESDDEDHAHALQKRPDGTADYIRFRPDQVAHSLRWICRTPDKNAIAIVSPATSGVEGFTTEKEAGRVVALEAGATWRVDMVMGTLTATETDAMIDHINHVMDR
ncbi:MAG: DUF4432 family protein [Pseudomonadota bacterium]